MLSDLRKQKSISSCNLGASFNASTAPAKNAGRGTLFRMYFDRGDLPIKMEYLCGGDKIGWTVSTIHMENLIEKLLESYFCFSVVCILL